MSIRALQWILVFGCIAELLSALTGVQSYSYNSATGSQIGHYSGKWEYLWSVAIALICGLGAWGIHRRAPITWALGWSVLVLSAIWTLVEVAANLLSQPYGWLGILGAVAGVILVVCYWGIWWQRHREYFSAQGAPSGWQPDLTPLRWFVIGMFAVALLVILAAVLAPAFRK